MASKASVSARQSHACPVPLGVEGAVAFASIGVQEVAAQQTTFQEPDGARRQLLGNWRATAHSWGWMQQRTAGALVLSWLALHGAAAVAGPAANGPPWVAVPAAVALGELATYALHRWSHRGGWGWKVHAVHHAPVRLNASNNLTTHPFNTLWNQFARTLPWLVQGFEPRVIAWAVLFIQVQSFAVHANIAGTLGPLSRWIGTAELHRWHHSVDAGEALNFSTALPVWDQVFGTYKEPSVRGPSRLGIAGMPAEAGWSVWWRMLLAPICSRCA